MTRVDDGVDLIGSNEPRPALSLPSSSFTAKKRLSHLSTPPLSLSLHLRCPPHPFTAAPLSANEASPLPIPPPPPPSPPSFHVSARHSRVLSLIQAGDVAALRRAMTGRRWPLRRPPLDVNGMMGRWAFTFLHHAAYLNQLPLPHLPPRLRRRRQREGFEWQHSAGEGRHMGRLGCRLSFGPLLPCSGRRRRVVR